MSQVPWFVHKIQNLRRNIFADFFQARVVISRPIFFVTCLSQMLLGEKCIFKQKEFYKYWLLEMRNTVALPLYNRRLCDCTLYNWISRQSVFCQKESRYEPSVADTMNPYLTCVNKGELLYKMPE